MWNRFSGRSDISKDDLPSQSSRRNDDQQRQHANRSASVASTTSNYKNSSRAKHQDPQGFSPISTSRPSAPQEQDPRAALASVPSNETSASGNNDGVTHMPHLADRMPRSSSSRSSRDKEQAREIRDKKRGKAERSDGRDKDVERRQKRDKRDKEDKRLRRSEEENDEEFGASRGPDDFPDQIASSGFTQFPSQYDGAMPAPNGAANEHSAMSSHVQDQFPGQFPTQSSVPYRPPLAASEGGPGLAAEYYGDTGQSVAEQPGNRTDTPSLIIGAEPHLQPALAVAAPPPEPSASGAVGAAASFFSGEFEDDELASTHGQQDSSTYVTSQVRPNSNHPSFSAPVIPTIGGTMIGSAAGYLIENQTSSHQQRPDHESSIGGGPNEYSSMTAHRPPSEMQDLHYSSISQPSKPGKRPSQLSNNLMYAAGLAGAAGSAAALHEHNNNSSNHNILSSTSQYSMTSMAQRHRNRGPFSALMDFFKDPEGVAQFEEYSQIIGVCRHCFAPGSSPRDAPRKHYYGRRRSNERYASSTRVDKDNRYYSSENESRRKNNSWFATGLAGINDTYSVRTGRFPPDGRERRARRRSRSKEHVEIGITGDSRSDRNGTRDDISNGSKTTTFSTRRHSRTRSGSKVRKTEAAIGAAMGTSVVASSSRRKSRSPRRKSVKSKSTSQPPSPERRHTTKKKKSDKGFFSFAYGSSSSSSVDLTYTDSGNKHRTSRRSTGKSKEDKNAEAALLGLGAAAAALALNDGRQSHRKKGVKKHVRARETKDHDRYGSEKAHRPNKSSKVLEDELWESAAEDDYESMDSNLAYGGAPVRRGSRASSSSESSGTNKWGWRWGSKKDPKTSPPQRKSSDHNSFPAVASAASTDLIGAASTFPDHRQGSAMTSTSSLPLQHVFPVPTSDPSRFDVGPEAPISSPNRPALSSRPEAVPLQHPRPIAPVSAAIYSSQTAYDHSYSAPTGVAVFSQIPYRHSPGTSGAQHNNHEASIPGSLPRFEQQADDTVRDSRVRRRNTSPAGYGAESISSSMAPRRRSSVKDEFSAVRFDLTEEQEEKERRERRRKRKQDKERREVEEQEQTEKERRASEGESFEERGSNMKPEKGPERSTKSWVGPTAAAVVGAAIGSAAATEKSRSEETREERRERRRLEREREDEEDAFNKSERRRRQRERDDQKAAFNKRGGLPNEISTSNEYMERQERPIKRQDISVWQEAARTKRSSSHEDYGAFFTPRELLNKSNDQVKITSANADADIDLDQVPQIVTVEPKRVHDLSDSPALSFADVDDKVDPSRPSLPWQVPRLRLVEPTPPSTRGSTPVIQPKDAGDEDFEEPRKDVSPSKVKWADDQKREYTIIAPKEDCDEFIEPPSGGISGTDPVDPARNIHERDLPDDRIQQHKDSTPDSSSTSYGEDVGFAVTLAASAEDAGFDPSIVMNNPTYRRRDSPPGSNERGMPGAFDLENEPQLKKKERKRKDKVSSHPSQNDVPNGRDDDTIVQDIISQVKESEFQPPEQVPGENVGDERESARSSERMRSEKGQKSFESADNSFRTSEFASEALNSEDREMQKSPTEDVSSIASISNEAEDGRTSPGDSKRETIGCDDAASTVAFPSTTESSKYSKPKPKGRRKSSIWNRVLGSSTDNHPQENTAKAVTEQAILKDSEVPEKNSKISMAQESSRNWDNEYDSPEPNSIGGTTPQVPGSFSQDLPVKAQGTTLTSTFSDAGSVAKYLDHGVELGQVEEKQPESFLGMRPEPPPPPDTGAGNEEFSVPLETTSLPTLPRAESETKSRRFSDAETSNSAQGTATLPSSPTAVPFHFRRPGGSSSTARSQSQTPISEKYSADQILPSSRSTSRSSSVHASEERENHKKRGSELNETQHEPIEMETAPTVSLDKHSLQPHLLGSQQATPTASSFQDSATILNSPAADASKDSSPKVVVEESPQPSFSTPKSGIVEAILGGSAAVAMKETMEKSDPLRQNTPQEEDEDFERGVDDIVLERGNYGSYDHNLDQEKDLYPQKAKKGKKNKRKAGQSRQETVQPSFTGSVETKKSMEAVDPEVLSPEAKRQIQEQDAQDAVDSWSPLVRSSTKAKRGKRGRGRLPVESLPEEIGPSPITYEPPEDNLETMVSAEGREKDSLTREMSRNQVVNIMTAAAQVADRDESKASQSAAFVVQASGKIQAMENRAEPKGEKATRRQENLPEHDLLQDNLQKATVTSDDIPQEDLRTKTLPPHDIPQRNFARDDLTQEKFSHDQFPQLEVQRDIRPEDVPFQVRPPRQDFSQSQELQTLSVQDDSQPDTLPAILPSSPRAIVPYLEKGSATPSESPKTHSLSQNLEHGDLISAMSPQPEFSPRAIPLPDSDDEHDLSDEWFGTPTLTSLGRQDNEDKAIENSLDVSHLPSQSPITSGPQEESQAHPSQVDQVDAGRYPAPLPKENPKKSFSAEGDETAEVEGDDGPLPYVVSSTAVGDDWLKDLNDESAIEIPQEKSEMGEFESGGFPNSKKSKVENEAKQSSSAENSKTSEIHERRDSLPHMAAPEVLEDDGALKERIDESAVDVSQRMTESPKNEWTGFNDKDQSEKRKELPPSFSTENNKTTEIEETELLSEPAAFKELEYREALDLTREPAMHVPESGPVEEVPIELVDELPTQTGKPEMLAGEWAHPDSKKTNKQAEKQGSGELHLGPRLEETEHQSEQRPDARGDLNDRSLSLATRRTSQEVSAKLGLSENEASIGDEPKEAFPDESQAKHKSETPSEDRIVDRDGRNIPVLVEPETTQLDYTLGKAHDGDGNLVLDKLVASTNAAQVVQDISAGENDAESATDTKSGTKASSTGMEEATTVTPVKEDEVDRDTPKKKKKKGKKGKKNEAFSWDEAESIPPAEVSGPTRTIDARLEQEAAQDRPIEEGDQDRDAPKKKKKGKKGKKNEVFSWEEPETLEPGNLLGPAAAVETSLLEQEPAAKANDEMFPKPSKKDKKNKKGKRKGVLQATDDFGDEDESNAVPTKVPQDEDKTEGFPAIASRLKEENKPGNILTQALQDDNNADELRTVAQNARDDIGPGVVSTETLHDDDQVETRSCLDQPSITSDIREEIEPKSILTEAPPNIDNPEGFSADVMSPPEAEIVAPGEDLNQAVPPEAAQDDEGQDSREAPQEQEERFTPPKGKKDKRKSKKSKRSTAVSLDEDEISTRGEGQVAGTEVFEKDASEQIAPFTVDVVDESENSVPKLQLEQGEDFTLPPKRKGKKKSKKSSAISVNKDILTAIQDEPESQPESLEQEAPKETFSSSVGVAKEPGTSFKSHHESKGDPGQIEDATAQSEPEPAQETNKDSESDMNFNTTKVLGDLGTLQGKGEQAMHEDFDSISAHAATPELSQTPSSSVTSSLEQPAGASEEILADHAKEVEGNIVPAVETAVGSLSSLKPSKKEKKMAKKARPLTWEEDGVSQEPRVTFSESSATDLAGEPSIIPMSQHDESWSKPEMPAQEVEAEEIVQPDTRSEEDRGHLRSESEETPSQGRHDIQKLAEAEVVNVMKGTKDERTETQKHFIPVLEEDRSPTDGREPAGVTATSPLQRIEQTSEEQPGDRTSTAAAIRSGYEDPTKGLKREQIPVLAEPGAKDEAKDEDLIKEVTVQMTGSPRRQQDEAQRNEPEIENSSLSVAPGPAQGIVETVRDNENAAGVEPLGSLSKDKPIPTIEVDMLDVQQQREYNEEYVRERERAVPNAGPVTDVESLEGPDIDINKRIPAVEVKMLDAQEQRDYNEEYAKELERQLSPLQEGERADSSRDEANTPEFSQSSVPSVVNGPYEEEHRPLARPPALEDIIEESSSRPGSVQGSRIDQEDEFPPMESAKKAKKGKKGQKKQPVIWEDETATPPLHPDIDQGAEPSIRSSEGLGSWTTDTARPLDLGELQQQSLEDRTVASLTGDFHTAYKKSEIEHDRSSDYFALQPSIPAEEDVGMGDTEDFRRALTTESPHTTNDRFPAPDMQVEEGGHTRDDAFKAHNQDDRVAPLATDPRLIAGTEVEPAEEKVDDSAPMRDTKKDTKPENEHSPREPNPKALGQEDVRNLQTLAADTLNERSPPQQYSLELPSPEDESSPVADQRSTSRARLGSLEKVAAVVDSGVGALTAESLCKRDSNQERGHGKKANEVRSWTDSEAELGEPENAPKNLDRVEITPGEPEHQRAPALERAGQHHQATRTPSPSSANHEAIADHPVVGNLGRASETPEYRDSAIYVPASPINPEEIPYHHAARDSGYPDTEVGPPIDDELESLSASTKLEGIVAASEKVAHVQHRHSQAQEPERLRSSSRDPLDITIEADSEDYVSVTRPRERRKRSRRRSGVAYDSDDSADSGFDVQRRRRRKAMAAEPREPSPVSSTTKDRSSALFDSSPSAREDIAAKSQDRDLSPRYDPVGEKPTWSFDCEGSPQQVSREGRSGNSPEVSPDSTDYTIFTGHDEAAGTSLFGGPRSHDDGIISPARSPLSSEGRGRRRLNTISEDSADGSPLHKKDKRALSDVGSPESGVKGRRIRSSPVEGDVAGEYVFTHDPNSRPPWLAAEEEKGAIEERSRSRNSDQLSTLSSRHSGRAGVSFGQREEEHRTGSAGSMRSDKNSSIHAIIRTPDQVRSASGLSYRSSATPTPPLRRVDRSASGDLRGASRKDGANSHAKSSSEFHPELELDFTAIPSSSTYDPVTDKGKSRADMTDVYQGWGDVRGQSPMSPTRPPSMRKRQSMQLLDLETRLDQLVSENRLLASQKLTAESALQEQARDHSQERHAYEHAVQEHKTYLARKDSELSELKRIIEQLHDQAAHLTEVNEELTSSRGVHEEHEQKYNQLQINHAHAHEQWQQSARELENLKEQHTQLSTGMEDIVRHEVTVALEEKNIELRQLQSELENAKQQVRNLQQQLLASRSSDDFVERDEDWFDSRCQSLCQHVQQWVLRFSKFSDMKACYLPREIQDEKVVDRMENAILDGSDVDEYLSDRVKRRDVFMSVVMTMIWEFIFTRYLFGMDREQRQKLKNLEKTLQEVGPISAVHKWRATTLTLLMKREAFEIQRATDTEAVVHEIYDTLATFLPPPSHLVGQIQDSLRKVIDAAVDLSIEMRTQRAEYSMLPPLQPEYDTNGDLARKVYFSALTMNERSGATSSNEALQEQQAVVRMVLFPLVVKNEDDDEQIVVCPAQVLTAEGSKAKKTVRVLSAQGGRSEASFAGSDVRMEGGLM